MLDHSKRHPTTDFTPLPPGFDAGNLLGYRDGVLHLDDVSIADLAQTYGTPSYVFSQLAVEQAYLRLTNALDRTLSKTTQRRVCYAVKANANRALLTALARLNAGADVVSLGEIKLALAAGFKSENMVFAGVGKTRDEITEAVALGIGQLNAESEAEIDVIAKCAAAVGKTARVALRVNPDVDARTHAKISTGKMGDKFGISLDRIVDAYERVHNNEHLTGAGLAVHIGSQITDPAPFAEAFEKLGGLVKAIRGRAIPIDHLDLGGGLGIRYQNETPIDPALWAKAIADIAEPLGCHVTVEPGRYIVGPAGIMLAEVLYLKDTGDRRIVILDGSMSELIRPSLYDAWHEIVPINEPPPGADYRPVDLVGPVCESGDTFAQGRMMPPLAVGDTVAFLTAGAYTNVMASNYNARVLPPEIVVKDGQHHAVRPRQDFAQLIAGQTLPSWL
ncbi:MAG: diaminopimelate decarboxylase [Pseudomonadota bacterium]